MDQLGIGVSIYFKLLKSMIFLLLVSFVMYIPLMAVYSTGLASKQINGALQQAVSATFLGNLGEYSHRCARVNVTNQPAGGHIFGLTCPTG